MFKSMFLVAVVIALNVINIADLQAEPRLVSMRWKEVASNLVDTRASQIADTGEYRLRISRALTGSTVRRFVAFNEITRVNTSGGQSISMVSAALDLYHVIGLGDDMEEQEEIQMHVTGGTVLDFRFRVEFESNGQVHLFLTSLVPGRPGAWGDWELSTNGFTIEEMRSQLPEQATQTTAISR